MCLWERGVCVCVPLVVFWNLGQNVSFDETPDEPSEPDSKNIEYNKYR